MTGADRSPLPTDLRKLGVLHAFLGRLTAKVVLVPGLADLTLLGVFQDGRAYILHSLFSVPFGPYNLDQRLFGCHGEIPSEALPVITEILVASFGERRSVRDLYQDNHRVHLE